MWNQALFFLDKSQRYQGFMLLRAVEVAQMFGVPVVLEGPTWWLITSNQLQL